MEKTINNEIFSIKDLKDFEDYLNGKENVLNNQTEKSAIYLIKNKELEKTYFILDSSIPEYKKMPKLAAIRFLQDMKLLIAMANNYIPIFDKETKELLYTEEEYISIRKKMSGMPTYHTGDYIFSEDLYFHGIEKYLEVIDKNFQEINTQRNIIFEYLRLIVEKLGLKLGTEENSEVRLIDTGSTARGTNIPTFNGVSNFDFDFIMQTDYHNIKLLKSKLGMLLYKPGDIINDKRIRLKNVVIPGLNKPLDIDISFVPKKEKYLSTEASILERLTQIKKQDEYLYRLVIANIMHAKKILKEGSAYKPNRSDKSQGGLGGIGIENWILQHGGSLTEASKSFLAASEGKDFIEFEKVYPILDLGKNHMSVANNTFPYDNFVMKNMREQGYKNMQNCLINYLYNQLEQPLGLKKSE